VLAGDLPMPETARPDVPAPLARICRRALSRSPADRHATARHLADELEAAMSELGIAASHREIGTTVARLFADVHSETKRAIEMKLGRASMSIPIRAVAGDSGELRAGQTPSALPPRRRLALAVIAGAGLIGFAGLGFWRSGAVTKAAESVAPAAAPTSPIAAPAPAPAGPQTHLTAKSPDAMARPEESTPAPAAGPRAAKPGGGVAKAALRRPQPVTAPAKPGGAAGPAPAAGGAPAPVPAPVHDCAHPFFVDSEGIKRFRPECM